MLNVLTLLLAAFVVATKALTATEIFDEIGILQQSRPFVLDQNALSDPDSYQSKARQSAVDNLANVAGYQTFQVREYYAAACIYHATNGVGNPQTQSIIPDEPIPNWIVTTLWLAEPNYCLWFGILCYNSLADESTQNDQELDLLIVEINLSQNNLYGQFPNEIALLSSSIIAIDLFDNFFHWANDYRWMIALENLEALFFGRTSWQADGVPLNLRFMTKLQEIDMSNAFWTGELTENAFNNLKQLRYLDMGQNFFDIDDIETLPDYISGLPLITNLYIDNIRPVSGNPTRLSLSFISRMINIIEMWADYTNVLGPIPGDIGDAKTLQSFSCVYCKLEGPIPDSIVNTNIDRMWLYGNPNLNGQFPPNFGTLLDWRYLYLEGTGIFDTLPKSLCDQVGVDETRDLLELGADCNVCPAGCCTCCGDECNNLRSPTPAPTDQATGAIYCFSGDMIVDVQDYGPIKLSELALGDSIRVANSNKYEPVYSFGHKNQYQRGEFLSIHTEGNRRLDISEDHMVMMEDGGRIIPASMVQIGDNLLVASGDDGLAATVTSIRTVKRTGVYAPFTESGTIVVNDIVASNYVAFQGGVEHVHVLGNVKIPGLHYHWMAHIFNSVHRMAYKMGIAKSCDHETCYSKDGTSHWVAGPRDMGLWLMNEAHPLVMAAGLVAFVFFFGVASMIEFLLMKSSSLAMAVCVLSVVAARRRLVSSFKNKMAA